MVVDSMQAKADQLKRVLESIAGSTCVTLLAGHPDPDAIGSALAHQRICNSLGIASSIAHVLPVSHRDNRALVKLLSVDMLQVQEASELAQFDYLSLVDTCAPEPTVRLPADLRLLSVVDHHRTSAPPEALFVDVRPDVGACSTIYAEYLQAGLAPLHPERPDDWRVAAALFLGIQTDTDDFSSAMPADFRAAAHLKPHTDAEVLRRIGRRTISAQAMDLVHTALSRLVVVRDFAVAGVGRVTPTHRDTIAVAADYIVRREDIDTVIVFGIVDDRVDGSLRTTSVSVDPAAFLKSAFGKATDGRPYGGGRADKGGFQIPLGMFAAAHDKDGLWLLVEQLVISQLSKVVPDLEPAWKARRISP